MPPRRHALRREALLAAISPSVRLPRHRMASRGAALATAASVFLALAGAGLAIAHYDFLAEQSRIDTTMWEPPPLRRTGPRVEVARGSDWSFMAWNSERGVCVGYAAGAGARWSRTCGRAPGTPADGPHAASSVLVFGLVSGVGGSDALLGAVDPEVSRVAFELADGSVVSATTMHAPDLDTTARFFLIRRSFVIPAVALPIRAVETYDAYGAMIERAEIAPARG
ncbi:MAG TPA: hypothetical protein VF101_12950 [Gaiellaceae bacterium]